MRLESICAETNPIRLFTFIQFSPHLCLAYFSLSLRFLFGFLSYSFYILLTLFSLFSKKRPRSLQVLFMFYYSSLHVLLYSFQLFSPFASFFASFFLLILLPNNTLSRVHRPFINSEDDDPEYMENVPSYRTRGNNSTWLSTPSRVNGYWSQSFNWYPLGWLQSMSRVHCLCFPNSLLPTF